MYHKKNDILQHEKDLTFMLDRDYGMERVNHVLKIFLISLDLTIQI